MATGRPISGPSHGGHCRFIAAPRKRARLAHHAQITRPFRSSQFATGRCGKNEEFVSEVYRMTQSVDGACTRDTDRRLIDQRTHDGRYFQRKQKEKPKDKLLICRVSRPCHNRAHSPSPSPLFVFEVVLVVVVGGFI